VSLTTLKYGPLSWFSESKPVPLSPCRHQAIEGYSSDSCLTSPLGRVSGERHVPAAFTPENGSRYSLDRRLVGPQNWSGNTG
jgi:hypothetical protein